MSDQSALATPDAGSASAEAGPAVRSSNYDIIRRRLGAQGEELRRRAQALNELRKEHFGSTALEIVGQERIRTENNCLPVDIISLGDTLLFGYNVYIGLKKTTAVDDVFSLHTFQNTPEGITLEKLPPDSPKNFLEDPNFQRHFQDLYTYYKDAHLLQLRRTEGRLLAIFQIGTAHTDIRVLRWSISPTGEVQYLDNSGERDHQPVPTHDFIWTKTTRDDHVQGRHPHINILDELFVETIGGDLTIKIEDNTDDGQGIYAEPVADKNQSLGDADIQYAALGSLIALKIRPYREEETRYFIYNRITHQVMRLDAIGQSCVQLPEDQGLIFPGGYVLTTGEVRTFEADVEGMRFVQATRSPNGEDVLYVFYNLKEGRYALLAYNLIRKEVQNPVHCHGYCIFDDGSMIVFRAASDEPTRVHPVQIWQTPFISDEFAAAQPTEDSFLSRIGNAELVRGISECLSIARMTDSQEPTMAVYESLIAAVQRTKDSYFWLGEPEAQDLASPLKEIAQTAELIIDEFVKVQDLQKRAGQALRKAEQEQQALLRDLRFHDWRELERFIEGLSALRAQRGKLITLRDTRYIDRGRLDKLEQEAIERFDDLSLATVDFLLGDDALSPYEQSIQELADQVNALQDTLQAARLQEELDKVGQGLALLTEVVSTLQIEDPRARTEILEGISQIMSLQNRARAMIDGKRQALLEEEGRAEFAVQFQLLGQSVQSAANMAKDPESCDELLTRTMVQLEEMESRFSEFDTFLGQLAEKREEIYETFENKKQNLLEERQRRAHTTAQAANRILDGVPRRTARIKSVDELNTYFATDPMILKVLDLVETLRELKDPVRADDIETRYKAVQDEAIRALRDKIELFEEGDDQAIRFGSHRFSVNTQDVELTMIARDGQMMLHITGTDFFEPVDDEDFLQTKEFWDQYLLSESPQVYRAEFLAASILFDAEAGNNSLSIQQLRTLQASEEGFGPLIRRYLEERYDEGYEPGVHDADTALILDKVLGLYLTADLLRFNPLARSLALLFWAFAGQKRFGRFWTRQAQSFGRLRQSLEHHGPLRRLGLEFAGPIEEFGRQNGILKDEATARQLSQEAGAYLAEELVQDSLRFTISEDAAALRQAFLDFLDQDFVQSEFREDLAELQGQLSAKYALVKSWLEGFVHRFGKDHPAWQRAIPGATALFLIEDALPLQTSSAPVFVQLSGLLGRHRRIEGQTLAIHLDEFLTRLRHYIEVQVPKYQAYRQQSRQLLERERRRLRLEELEPRVLSTFVRNTLIDQVYLPLIGANFAKQLGSLGDTSRSDRSGLLLLISPPGYGKTTLMEYIASRLGLVFMSISGPSLGHEVTSLDPAEAPNATARQEVEKVNLALEMGNNVLLYIDDIQHTHSEFLQKFISLCDATRRIEGVWRGRSRTYDMRGKRFAVVMAGNPYNEAGERFRLPDMLANRADTYNLGDIIGDQGDAFALSYIENSLAANEILAPLAARDRDDLMRFLRIANGESIALTEMAHDYSPGEASEIVAVLQKLMQVQKTLLRVNQAYITSANQDDRYRTEPPFLLQGSYRNMARLAERIVPALNDEELEALIDDHYIGEAQTLTTGAEANLLKLAELRARQSPEQKERWEAIKREFQRRNMLGGDDDPINRVATPLTGLVQKLGDVHSALATNHLGSELTELRQVLQALLQSMEK